MADDADVATYSNNLTMASGRHGRRSPSVEPSSFATVKRGDVPSASGWFVSRRTRLFSAQRHPILPVERPIPAQRLDVIGWNSDP